jgi:hypothetical protein
MGKLRKTSTEHNNVWIDNVNRVRQPTCQSINMPGECRSRGFVSSFGAGCNLYGCKTLACRSGVVGSHAGA